jgi:hypothetical protein
MLIDAIKAANNECEYERDMAMMIVTIVRNGEAEKRDECPPVYHASDGEAERFAGAAAVTYVFLDD